ncbi:hypothetical protein [uncultured Pelagimonas sp.]|uniref:hypothetical protein n=1 Tax=uncultured Pelagimonas sp. TaxID=1618102 RepID=UPI00262F219B|nr:hypothetical protein [uncultured Pelagimonas sp.]
MTVALLGLLAISMLALMIGDSDDSSSSDDTDAGPDDGAISPSADAEVVEGTSSNDLMDALNFERVTLEGRDGDDTLVSGVFADSADLRGGAGDDLITTAASNTALRGGEGDDTLEGGFNAYLSGGDGNDSLSADEQSVLLGDAGDDALQAREGSYLYGGDGDDTLEASDPFNALGDLTPINLEGGSGADTYRIVVSPDETEGNEALPAYLISDFDLASDELRIAATDGSDLRFLIVDAPSSEGSVVNVYQRLGVTPIATIGLAGVDAADINDDDSDEFLRFGQTEGDDLIIRATPALEGTTGADQIDVAGEPWVTTGEGNDTVAVLTDTASYVDLGSGDDVFSANGEATVLAGDGEDTINVGPGAVVEESDGADDIFLDLSDAANSTLVSEIDFGDDTDSLEITLPTSGGPVVALTLHEGTGGSNGYDDHSMILVQIEDGYSGAIDDTLMQGIADEAFHGDPVEGLPAYRTIAEIDLGARYYDDFTYTWGAGLNEVVDITYDGVLAGTYLEDV